MTTILRHALWRVLADPARRPPARYMQCRQCEEKSPVTPVQAEGDLWAMTHSGRTQHTQYREFAATDLITKRVRGGSS